MMRWVYGVALSAALAPLAAAHGYVSGIAIDGTWYAGNQPNNYRGPSPIRLISDIGPVKGASNPDLTCGLSAQPAELIVPANPGSVFSVQWSGGDGVSKWPHNTGPLMTYMAPCEGSCSSYNATGAKWFKIDQLGLKSDGTTWYQADISSNGDAFDVTLPTNLAPGGYLIRHEIIALHLAVTLGGAEFYPMCTQVLISGSGSGTPLPIVSFPGAYKDDDPGIYDPDVFNPGANYTFPGGPVANLAGTDASMASPWTGPTVFPSGTSVPPAASATAAPTHSAHSTGAGGATATATGGGATATDTPAPANRVGTCALKPPTQLTKRHRHLKLRSLLARFLPASR